MNMPSRMGPGSLPPVANSPGSELIAQGKMLRKVEARYVTAIDVVKPRNLELVAKAMLTESKLAGRSFYYHMVFKGKKSTVVEGGTIGLAYSLIREYTNAAVMVEDVVEDAGNWTFYPVFVDVEKGVQIQRAFRARKDAAKFGKFDDGRKLDMAFQVAQSKASRNVIFAGTPAWLKKDCVAAAKLGEANKITREGLGEAKAKAVAFFKNYGVTVEMLVQRLGVPFDKWDAMHLAELRGDGEAIMSKDATVQEMFPAEGSEPDIEDVMDDPALGATAEPVHQEEIVATVPEDQSTPADREPGADEGEVGMTDAEKAAALKKEADEANAFTCPFCNEGQPSADDMTRHIQDKHRNPKPEDKKVVPPKGPPPKANPFKRGQ